MKFSIIVPVYDVASYLQACLDSVLVQTCPDWECICVDDGSRDGSGDILDAYSKRDARFKVIRKENEGVAVARNVALREALGEYCLFLDADDVLLSDKMLERLRTLAMQYGSHALIGFKAVTFSQKTPVVAHDESEMKCYEIGHVLPFAPSSYALWAVCYPRNLMEGCFFPKMRVGEDRLFLLKVLLKANRFVGVTDVFYGYRWRADSAVHARWSVQVIKDHIDTAVNWFVHVDLAGRALDAQGARWWALWLAEGMSFQVLRRRGGEFHELWPYWKNAIRKVGPRPDMPLYPRLIMRLFSCVPIKVVVWLLGYLPQYLKFKGFHR